MLLRKKIERERADGQRVAGLEVYSTVRLVSLASGTMSCTTQVVSALAESAGDGNSRGVEWLPKTALGGFAGPWWFHRPRNDG
jgi:hypothetical protein